MNNSSTSNVDILQKIQQDRDKMESYSKRMINWYMLHDQQQKADFERDSAKAQQEFKEEKIVDFMFFAVLIMIASFMVLTCGSAVWQGDYASAVFVSPITAFTIVLTVVFYRGVVSVPFEPLQAPMLFLKPA